MLYTTQATTSTNNSLHDYDYLTNYWVIQLQNNYFYECHYPSVLCLL